MMTHSYNIQIHSFTSFHRTISSFTCRLEIRDSYITVNTILSYSCLLDGLNICRIYRNIFNLKLEIESFSHFDKSISYISYIRGKALVFIIESFYVRI